MAKEPQTAEGKKKRQVKNPETFRERAIKAAETSEQPTKRHRLRGFIRKFAGPILRPIGKVLHKIFYRQPFRFIGRILLPRYFRDSWQELQLVEWPKWRQSLRLTSAVLIFAIIFGVTIAALDYGLDKIFRQLILR